MRSAPGACAVILAFAGAAAAAEVAVRVEIESPEVEFGRPFALTVVRTWPDGFAPREWSDGALAPLLLEPGDTVVRRADGGVEETRRFRARAFRRGTLPLPAPEFEAVPPGGGAAVRVRAQPLRITVRSSVDAADPGPPEPPPDPLPVPPERRPRRTWLLTLGALSLAAAAAVLATRRRRPPPPPPPPEPGDPAEAALDDLRALASVDGADGGDGLAPAADRLRAFLGVRFDVRTAERTSAELLADAAVADGLGGRVATARALFDVADLVKFARLRPERTERERWFADARALVESLRRSAAAAPRGEGRP